ncbi:dTDP-4-dehydrorhamnose 3,5-epimerase [Muriicola jejuensis]|uniref:dTDP-4-dehydrorhamnose 3,5-epimerase n=1 Tax=Muriicola jejuensis TaxID=504488 RepID=A0A6P0UBD1_9FLAO|nr:dTDP-4-dehydrorhamnose 3,5-epimerase [Muriicola jejuensis]NER09912.1 dTDP-4-dehydrorhamnose 3,5-epimerase [Muriicola jejuensis]
MEIKSTNIQGCYILEPVICRDARGVFMETFHKKKLETLLGGPLEFVQDNQSVSNRNVLRGLHFQKGEHAQAKLGRVVRGRALDVVVDLREKSKSFREVFTIELSEYNNLQLFIPRGLAHGFLALEDQTVFSYKCDAYYYPGSESGIIYNDPELAIDWGIPDSELIISEKDRRLQYLKELFP